MKQFGEHYQETIEANVFQEGRNLIEAGAKVVGIYCAFTPEEVIAAAKAIPVSLCAGTEKPIPTAEKHLPRNLCPLIKASYGHALDDTCPYFHYSDFLFADATCDGKKKMFELLKGVKPVHVLYLPQTYEQASSVKQWMDEIHRMIEILERETGNIITEEALREQIKLFNEHRQTVQQVYELNRGDIPFVFGREADVITGGGGFDCHIDRRIQEMKEAITLLQQRKGEPAFMQEMADRPRLLLTGCPSTNKKVMHLLEDSGAVIVAMETCGGLKTVSRRVNENQEPLAALAEYYVNIACPCMTPNPGRFQLLKELIHSYRVEGVVELTWHACHTYNVEAEQVKRFITKDCDMKYLHIETDYSENDIGQLRLRIEAFVEMLQSEREKR
ncbi:double-cubane-cluster-containing anaerobic reductase [Anoxynatronum sibiricum]|uniref:Double-cubane-cluster-containing anaerobic reductase n=1 Tax=Anoxynatronum sibiricum TaxID=210623 RepID=A0ABU9VTQ5_9CLOT